MELTFAAATQLRTLLRAAGAVGMPGVRVRPASTDGDLYEIVVEDRAEFGDDVFEVRGIRVHVDRSIGAVLSGAVLDLQGNDFVLRRTPAPAGA